MSTIMLFGNRFSGHSYKVRLFLKLTNTPHSYDTISLSQARNGRPEFFRKNARFDEVPLLMIDDQAYVQSNAILLHLSDMLGVMGGGSEKARVAEWLMWEQSRLGFSLPNLRFDRKFKTNPDPNVLTWLEMRLRDDLNVLENHLKIGTNFIVGNEPSIADCALAGYLYWLDDAGLEIVQWPTIEAWLRRLSGLKGWEHPNTLML
jgi:glutathione S-transferase